MPKLYPVVSPNDVLRVLTEALWDTFGNHLVCTSAKDNAVDIIPERGKGLRVTVTSFDTE